MKFHTYIIRLLIFLSLVVGKIDLFSTTTKEKKNSLNKLHHNLVW